MDCVEVCPVDCFYEGENMLVMHPDECIDCGVCEPECPVDAIKADSEPGLETLRSGRGSRTNSNTSRQIPARVIDAGYLPVAPENLVRRHSRGEEEIIASSNTTLVIIRLARNEHISSAIHPKAGNCDVSGLIRADCAQGRASRTFPTELSDFRRVCVGNRKILLQRKF